MSNTVLSQDEPQVDEPVEETAISSDTESVLSNLRTLRGQLGAQSKPLDLNVPGYDGLLLIRYKWVPFKTLTKNTDNIQRIKDSVEQQTAVAAETLIGTCQEFLVRVGDEIRPLSQDDKPIVFGDPRLSDMLGFPPTNTVRDSVIAVFGNEYAMIDQSGVVMEWLQDTTKRVDEAYLGN